MSAQQRTQEREDDEEPRRERVMGMRVRVWAREQQESKSVKGQQVPAPCFYKLQLIGHLVFSTQCNSHPCPPSPPTTPLPLSHVVLRWAAVTRQTRYDLGQHHHHVYHTHRGREREFLCGKTPGCANFALWPMIKYRLNINEWEKCFNTPVQSYWSLKQEEKKAWLCWIHRLYIFTQDAAAANRVKELHHVPSAEEWWS